ncbi:10067_t:CDS:2, partial [Racocetra fulgida]
MGSKAAMNNVARCYRYDTRDIQKANYWFRKYKSLLETNKSKLMFEAGDKVAIAYDYNNNQKTQKRKLEQTCSKTRTVVSMYSNNRMVRVDIDGE